MLIIHKIMNCMKVAQLKIIDIKLFMMNHKKIPIFVSVLKIKVNVVCFKSFSIALANLNLNLGIDFFFFSILFYDQFLQHFNGYYHDVNINDGDDLVISHHNDVINDRGDGDQNDGHDDYRDAHDGYHHDGDRASMNLQQQQLLVKRIKMD